MSYILEALKKAEADRHAEVVQPRILPSGPGAARQPLRQDGKRVRLWPVALVSSVLLAIGAGVTWYATDRGAPHEATAPIAEQPAVPAAPAPATPAMPPPVADSAAEPAVKPKEDVAKKVQAKRRRPADEPTRSAASAAPTNDIALPTLRELPEQLQRELPSLSVGG